MARFQDYVKFMVRVKFKMPREIQICVSLNFKIPLRIELLFCFLIGLGLMSTIVIFIRFIVRIKLALGLMLVAGLSLGKV